MENNHDSDDDDDDDGDNYEWINGWRYNWF